MAITFVLLGSGTAASTLGAVTCVPEPGNFVLIGSGLAEPILLRRRKHVQ